MTPSQTPTHDEHVDRQFGPAAAAYLTSAVHAQGDDLRQVAERLRARPAERALDVGCGAGHLSFAMAPHAGAVIACDLSPEMLAAVDAEAHRRGLANLSTRQAAAESLPFADGEFDLVCTRFSAHHWADLPRGLAEMRRVLRPGGRLIAIDIVAPAAPLLDTHLQAVELLRDPSHVRDHSVAEWTDRLGRVGVSLDALSRWPLRMEFEPWVARMKTPPDRIAVLRSLLQNAPREVREHFKVAADCSFDIESAMFEASL